MPKTKQNNLLVIGIKKISRKGYKFRGINCLCDPFHNRRAGSHRGLYTRRFCAAFTPADDKTTQTSRRALPGT
jgi:hypothetical protein